MKRGRWPIGDRASTAAERQQRRRDRRKAALPPAGSEDRFRLELYWWIKEQRFFFSKLTAQQISLALDELGVARRMDAHEISRGEKDPTEPTWIWDYLNRTGLCDPDRHKPEQAREGDDDLHPRPPGS